jgi:hypothetical protein
VSPFRYRVIVLDPGRSKFSATPRPAHPSVRHRRDRKRKLAVQEPCLTALASLTGGRFSIFATPRPKWAARSRHRQPRPQGLSREKTPPCNFATLRAKAPNGYPARSAFLRDTPSPRGAVVCAREVEVGPPGRSRGFVTVSIEHRDFQFPQPGSRDATRSAAHRGRGRQSRHYRVPSRHRLCPGGCHRGLSYQHGPPPPPQDFWRGLPSLRGSSCEPKSATAQVFTRPPGPRRVEGPC